MRPYFEEIDKTGGFSFIEEEANSVAASDGNPEVMRVERVYAGDCNHKQSVII